MSEVFQSKSLAELVSIEEMVERSLAENGGEITDEIQSWLANVEHDLPVKVDNYQLVMERLDSEAEMLAEKEKAYAVAKRALKNVKDRLKDRIKEVMQKSGKTELVGNNSVFKLSSSKPKLEIDMSLLPHAFQKQTIIFEADREKIQSVLDLDEEVMGVTKVEVLALRSSINKKPKGMVR